MEAQVRGLVEGAKQSAVPFTATYSGASRTADAHARFMQAVLEGRVFSGGMNLTSINNATFTTATTGATATPIIGIYNPPTNDEYLVIWQAIMGLTMTALQATGGGPFSWMAGITTTPLTLGLVPTNNKTLTPVNSAARVLAGVALTGFSGTLALLRGSSLGGGSASNAAFLATAVGMQTQQISSCENIDGNIIVPPGGVVGLFATTTPVAHSAVSGIVVERVPVGVNL